MSDSIYSIEVQTISGESHLLETYRDQVVLIVNTASRCGFTPQYTGLQELYDRYHAHGRDIGRRAPEGRCIEG